MAIQVNWLEIKDGDEFQSLCNKILFWEVSKDVVPLGTKGRDNPDQRAEYYDQLDERAAWLYEAVTNDPAMHGQKTGKGQVYMGAYKDKDGDWLDGSKNYVLHVPPNAPAEAFWSITLYDVDTRCLIRNEQKIADRSSRMDLIKNTDGSVDIYMGPDAPKGKEKNWIPTVAGKAWFPYFRLYSPKKAFLDRTWVLPDIEKAE